MKRKGGIRIWACLLICGILVVFTGCNSNVSEKEPTDALIEEENRIDKTTELIQDKTESTGPKEYTNPEWAAVLLSADTLVPNVIETQFRDPYPELMTAAQGGWTDGTYQYQAYIQQDKESDELNNKTIIIKYDLATGEQVQVSDYLQLNHANDITYNSKLGYLVVCHNKPAANALTYIDTDTLEHVKTFSIEPYISSISYNEKSNRYVVQLSSGGQKFQILDGEFNPISEIIEPTTRTKGYSTQGSFCDDDFVYFALYEENVITVYDWDGNFITLIDLAITKGLAEPENLTIIDGTIYMGTQASGNSGLRVYKMSELIPKAEETK